MLSSSTRLSVFRTHNAKRAVLLLLILEATAVLLWLPSILWPFTFTWDENTFYLVASRLLQGELPYTTTFENKSPLALLPQSLALLIVGDSPSALRLFAALMVGLSAFVAAVIAPGLRTLLPASLTGILMILLWVTRTNGLVWMSEVNITLLFLLALYLVTRLGGTKPWHFLLVGLIIGAIPLVRINWSFAALILFVAFAIKSRSLVATFVTGLASLLPLALVVLTYALSGSLDRLWAGAVALPRSLGDGEGWRLPTLVDDQLPAYWFASIVLITALITMSMRIQQIKGAPIDSLDWIILLVAWALTLGAWIQPYDFPYQTLQIVPLIALAVGRIFACAPSFQSVTAIPIVAFCFGFAVIVQTQVYSQFDWRNQSAQERAVTSAVAQIPNLADKTLWAPDNSNYLYWRLNKLPITPLASMPYLVWDPGGQRAYRGEVLSEGDASQYVFDLKPDIVVASNDYRGSYNGTDEAYQVWRLSLNRDYEPVAEVKNHTVWQRKD